MNKKKKIQRSSLYNTYNDIKQLEKHKKRDSDYLQGMSVFLDMNM